jgi:hypothetical protein
MRLYSAYRPISVSLAVMAIAQFGSIAKADAPKDKVEFDTDENKITTASFLITVEGTHGKQCKTASTEPAGLIPAAPELTCSANIKLHERVSLRPRPPAP